MQTSSFIVVMGTHAVVWTWLACHLCAVVSKALPLLSHQLSKVSGRNIKPPVGPMTLTSSRLASLLSGPSIEELLSCACWRHNPQKQTLEWEVHAWVFFQLSFAGMWGVAERFVDWLVLLLSLLLPFTKVAELTTKYFVFMLEKHLFYNMHTLLS